MKKVLAAGLFLFDMWFFGWIVEQGTSLSPTIVFPALGVMMLIAMLASYLAI